MITTNKILHFYILTILKTKSNADHPLNASQIAHYLQTIFQFSEENLPDRRTIYSSLSLLEDLSEKGLLDCEVFVEEKGGKKVGYFIIPEFTEGEIKLLCDAIASSRFISDTYSEELINKLGSIYGEDYTSKYLDILHFKSNNKSYNQDLFNSIEKLSDAIEKNRKVTFQYLKYNVKKELVPNNPKDNGWKTVTPYKLIWAINHYYLFCRYENSQDNRFLRVDKIRSVQELEQKGEPLSKHVNWDEYARNQVFMFGGKPEIITFRCKMIMLGQVIDFFGENVHIKPIDDDYFEVHAKTSMESIKYWILQYITAIDEIRPEKLRDEIVGFLEDALERNGKKAEVD